MHDDWPEAENTLEISWRFVSIRTEAREHLSFAVATSLAYCVATVAVGHV